MLVVRGPAQTLESIRRRADAEGVTYSEYVIDRCLKGEFRGRRMRYTDPEALQHIEHLAFSLTLAAKALRPLAKELEKGGWSADLEDRARRYLKGLGIILRRIWRSL